MDKLNTILFDLDGTLLPLDMDRFMKIYFKELGEYFVDIISPKKLISAIWDSTNEMVKNLENKTNEEVFMGKFEKLVPGDLETYKLRFDKFYDDKFIKTKDAVSENEFIKKSIKILKEKGYTLVIATNPLFPYKAIIHRIRWAGLDPDDFTLITNYENNHYCKPQIQFYEEILRDIDKEPRDCMMVGNDVQEDLIASELGLKTYLIKDHLLHRTEDKICCDYSGDYEEFYNFVIGLPDRTTQNK